MWEAIRKLRRFTVLDIEGETRASTNTIKSYLFALKSAGYIAIVDHLDNSTTGKRDPAKRRPAVYELQRDSLETPRVKRDGKVVVLGARREQLWRTMRMLKTFSVRELAVHASTEETPVAETDCANYLRYLDRAGYVAQVSTRPARYRFIPGRYTGPRPPMVQRVRQVYDPNLQRVVWPTAEGADE